MKGKRKHEPPLSIPLPFDQTIKLALQVKPPMDGKKKRRSKARKHKHAA